jgi:hypothetical protein
MAVDSLAEIIVDHETGRLVPSQDTVAMAAAALIEAPQTAFMMGRNGEQRVM